MRILPGSSVYHEREYTQTMTGHSFTFQKKLYNYDSPRSFHGDGYSITIYEIAPKDIDSIKEREIELINNYPKRGEYRQNWKVEKWKKAPMDSGDYQIMDFAFSEYDPDEDLKKWFSIIRKSLESEEVYYGYLYKGDKDWPMNVDFYLIDKQKNRMVIINHNT